VAVRLALFAEMMKTARGARNAAGRRRRGGLGATFLEENVQRAGGSAGHRLHQAAARGVLAALLPDGERRSKGTCVRGASFSLRQL